MAHEILARELKRLDLKPEDLYKLMKNDARKAEIAIEIRKKTTVNADWIGEHLVMGSRGAISNAIRKFKVKNDKIICLTPIYGFIVNNVINFLDNLGHSIIGPDGQRWPSVQTALDHIEEVSQNYEARLSRWCSYPSPAPKCECGDGSKVDDPYPDSAIVVCKDFIRPRIQLASATG